MLNRKTMPWFVRGDCNFSQVDHIASTGKDAVDIADPAAVIDYLFQTGYYRFIPKCLDACDANDDGRVDLSDAIAILAVEFLQAGRRLPPPFPACGISADEPGAGSCPPGTSGCRS